MDNIIEKYIKYVENFLLNYYRLLLKPENNEYDIVLKPYWPNQNHPICGKDFSDFCFRAKGNRCEAVAY